ncbi:adiponectin receptor protein [Anaeramoeba flamelloides]|uniref:Adiponectin receptor protein n=1 Tax=Anaeramoeba flamelloides TaxID=1746091 RepID=A0ABQ8YCA5_9EUKA|nr:adiponectin receptor protein [Anaeramoeba flamelloides]
MMESFPNTKVIDLQAKEDIKKKVDRSENPILSSLHQHVKEITKKVNTVLENQIVTFPELPKWLRFNHYIHRGYRVRYTIKKTWKSLFSLHNETLNIWTHFIGAAIFIYFFVRIFTLETLMKATITAKLMIAIYTLGGLICFLSSAFYHLWEQHSEKFQQFFLKIDLTGALNDTSPETGGIKPR